MNLKRSLLKPVKKCLKKKVGKLENIPKTKLAFPNDQAVENDL